jgi:IMP dehydrogenase
MDAREIMTRDVIAVVPDMAVDEATELLLHYRIHGAPVVDAGQQVIGMVSFVDLAAGRGKKVRDVMASDPVYASEDTPVDEIASAMLEQSVRRVPILEGGRAVGMVSASDIIDVFLHLHEDTPAAKKAKPRPPAAPRRRRGGGGRPTAAGRR